MRKIEGHESLYGNGIYYPPTRTGILLLGYSGCGKSTLSNILINNHGFRFVGDDVIILDSKTRRMLPGSKYIARGTLEIRVEDPSAKGKEASFKDRRSVVFVDEDKMEEYALLLLGIYLKRTIADPHAIRECFDMMMRTYWTLSDNGIPIEEIPRDLNIDQTVDRILEISNRHREW